MSPSDAPRKMQTYFVTNGSYIKIGHSTDVDGRLKTLRTSSPVPLRVVLVIDGDHARHFHELYAKHRVQGEWFALSGFYVWLMAQTERDDVVGDFARDAAEDRYFPAFEEGYYEIMNVVSLHHFSWLSKKARLAFGKAYREWLRVRRASGAEKVGFVGRHRHRLTR